MEVRYGLNGTCDPTIKDALVDMIHDGFTEIVAVPMFFAPGYVATGMIPKAIGLESGSSGGEIFIGGRTVSIRMTGTFGDHPKMRDVLRDVLNGSGADVEDTFIILISHGSNDGINSRTNKLNAGYVSEMGFRVICAYNEKQSPTIEEALNAAFDSGCAKIVAIPMFASPGNHSVREIPEQLGLGAGRRKIYTVLDRPVQLTYAQEIGTNPLVADILADRAVNG